MIYESSYWKNDLLKLAAKLERRLIQKRWRENSFFALEKELFIGFYSIRKLIESRKVSDSISQKKYDILEFPKKQNIAASFNEDFDKAFDFNSAKSVSVSVSKLCNQFIHSYHFGPLVTEEPGLVGFFICSDYKKETGIYFISIFDVVEIYREVGNNYPSTMHFKKTKNGNFRIKSE